MRIGVFAYNFLHWKTQMGLFNMVMNGIRPDVVYAQDWKHLDVPKPSFTPVKQYLIHPEKVAEKLSIPYKRCDHNDCVGDLDLGVILGARILPKKVIDSFRIGIINMHPGLLPQNRGLNNIEKAVEKGIPQGVTVHFIDEKVDSGTIIFQREIDSDPNDSLRDIHVKLLNLEQEMMVETLKAYHDS